MENYQQWMDEENRRRLPDCRESRRSISSTTNHFVEIPRAAAPVWQGRTEKLLVEYLGEYEVAG